MDSLYNFSMLNPVMLAITALFRRVIANATCNTLPHLCYSQFSRSIGTHLNDLIPFLICFADRGPWEICAWGSCFRNVSASIIITLSKSLIMTSKRANYRTCACREIKFPDAKLPLETGIELKGSMAHCGSVCGGKCKLHSHT
jgi:hypothetical protein